MFICLPWTIFVVIARNFMVFGNNKDPSLPIAWFYLLWPSRVFVRPGCGLSNDATLSPRDASNHLPVRAWSFKRLHSQGTSTPN